MTLHVLKVQPPYFDALLDGSKTFEVRRNDRAFQRGDRLVLCEWDPKLGGDPTYANEMPELTGRKVERVITFVYAGDPRFGGLEPGYVVLGLGAAS